MNRAELARALLDTPITSQPIILRIFDSRSNSISVNLSRLSIDSQTDQIVLIGDDL